MKIIYAKVKTKGKVELIPLNLYADGSLERNKSGLIGLGKISLDTALIEVIPQPSYGLTLRASLLYY